MCRCRFLHGRRGEPQVAHGLSAVRVCSVAPMTQTWSCQTPGVSTLDFQSPAPLGLEPQGLFSLVGDCQCPCSRRAVTRMCGWGGESAEGREAQHSNRCFRIKRRMSPSRSKSSLAWVSFGPIHGAGGFRRDSSHWGTVGMFLQTHRVSSGQPGAAPDSRQGLLFLRTVGKCGLCLFLQPTDPQGSGSIQSIWIWSLGFLCLVDASWSLSLPPVAFLCPLCDSSLLEGTPASTV